MLGIVREKSLVGPGHCLRGAREEDYSLRTVEGGSERP